MTADAAYRQERCADCGRLTPVYRAKWGAEVVHCADCAWRRHFRDLEIAMRAVGMQVADAPRARREGDGDA